MLVCRSCPRHVGLKSSWHLRRLMAGSACLRSVGERARVANDSSPNCAVASKGLFEPKGLPAGLGHLLFLSGALVWCKICGCYGEKRFKDLKRACQGPAVGGRASMLLRLLRGLHPVSKQPLQQAVRCATPSFVGLPLIPSLGIKVADADAVACRQFLGLSPLG